MKKLDYLVGRTVTKAVQNDSDVELHFNDGTHTVIMTESGCAILVESVVK